MRSTKPAKRSALAKLPGIEITGEQPGVLPGPEWMRINYPREKWTSAYTANVSIGQGFDLVTSAAVGDGLCDGRERRRLVFSALD